MKTDDAIVDVLLIGSGAAGGAFAWSLSQLKGVSVICLEQGDWDRRSVVNETQEQWEHLVKPAAARPGVAYFANGYPYDHTESYWEPVLGFAVGGGTVHYAAGWSQFRRSDFRWRTLTGAGDDWPFDYDELRPFYDMNDRMVGVAGIPGNPVYGVRDVELLPLPGFNKDTNRIRRACDKLGWFWWPGEQAAITVPFRGRDNRDFRERKNRTDVVYWPEAIRNGVELRTRATVKEVTVDKKGLASGAIYFDADGRLHEQRARIVVVACNGIGTPRLLLNSRSTRFPDGMANSTGLVGRGLLAHPKAMTSALFEEEDDSASWASGTIRIHEFYDPNPGRGFIGGFQMTGGNFSSPVAVALGSPPESLATAVPASLQRGGAPTRSALPWGRRHHAAFAERFRRTSTISAHTSELRDENNRVELDPTLTDDFGVPAPKLFYQRSDNTKKVLAYAMDRMKELMEVAGATQILRNAWDTETIGRGASPGHYFGTARMGTNRQSSVVDKWGRAHDVPNLFVIDGSTFPTSGATEPTSTIQANALRIADYFRTNARTLVRR